MDSIGRIIKYHMDKPIVRKQLYECLVKYHKGDLDIPHKSIRGESKKESENKSNYLVLVDDKKESQIIMSKYIEFASKKLGIQINVDQFRDGKPAVEYITNLDNPGIIDCILMYIEMPIMNGYDAASEMKNMFQT